MENIQAIEQVLDYEPGSEEQPNDAKLGELIIYLAQVSEADETFGLTKLNKLLQSIDFGSYARFGHSVTGQEYQAREYGPCPRRFVPVKEALETNEDIAVFHRRYRGYQQEKTIALRDPDLSLFTSDEIAFIDAEVRRWCGISATEMSRQSHQFVGWQLAEDGEIIPYEIACIQTRELSSADRHRGLELEDLARSLLGSGGD
jgi:hypothetical protein